MAYKNPSHFVQLPPRLLNALRTDHNQPSATGEPTPRQVIVLETIKGILREDLVEGHIEDFFCFNLLCRLCLRKFKKLDCLSKPLLNYLTYACCKTQSSTADEHTHINENKILGHFPVPSNQVIDECFRIINKEPSAAGGALNPQFSSNADAPSPHSGDQAQFEWQAIKIRSMFDQHLPSIDQSPEEKERETKKRFPESVKRESGLPNKEGHKPRHRSRSRSSTPDRNHRRHRSPSPRRCRRSRSPQRGERERRSHKRRH